MTYHHLSFLCTGVAFITAAQLFILGDNHTAIWATVAGWWAFSCGIEERKNDNRR